MSFACKILVKRIAFVDAGTDNVVVRIAYNSLRVNFFIGLRNGRKKECDRKTKKKNFFHKIFFAGALISSRLRFGKILKRTRKIKIKQEK
jgi:hypothetical protein